jgi:hypothetical protein
MLQVAAAVNSHVTSAPTSPAPRPSRFHELLSELNPLQYIPVVGTIYRAVTGDTIPENARIAGSLVVSGLTGGPVGIALNIGMTALEKLTGVDPEKIEQHFLASFSHPAGATPIAAPAQPAAAPVQLSNLAFSNAQLAAYGVRAAPDGALRLGALTGSDVLNTMELARLA